jgi:hypothetical protein
MMRQFPDFSREIGEYQGIQLSGKYLVLFQSVGEIEK